MYDMNQGGVTGYSVQHSSGPYTPPQTPPSTPIYPAVNASQGPEGSYPPPPPRVAAEKYERAVGHGVAVVRRVKSNMQKLQGSRPLTEDDKPEKKSILSRTAHFFIAPLAILDIITVVIRVVIAGSAIAAPALYEAYTHQGWGVGLNLGLLAALAFSVADGLQLWVDRYGQLRSRFNAAIYIKKQKTRQIREKQINRQLQRAMSNIIILATIVLASIVMLIFSQIAAGITAQIMKYTVSLVDAVAPMVALALISFADYESMDEDPSMITMKHAFTAIRGTLITIGQHARDDELSSRDVLMLKNGKDGNVDGMLDVAVPYDPQDDWMKITDICNMYGWLSTYNAKARQKLTYLVRKGLTKGVPGIKRGDNGQGYYVLRESLGLVIENPSAISEVDKFDRQKREAEALVSSKAAAV